MIDAAPQIVYIYSRTEDCFQEKQELLSWPKLVQNSRVAEQNMPQYRSILPGEWFYLFTR